MFSLMMCVYSPTGPARALLISEAPSDAERSIEMGAISINPIDALMKIEKDKRDNKNYNMDEHRQAIVAVLIKYSDITYQIATYLDKNPTLKHAALKSDCDWWGLAEEISNPSRDAPKQEVMTGDVTKELEERIVTAIVRNTWVCVSGAGYYTYDMYSCANQCQNCSCSTGTGLCYLPQECIKCISSSRIYPCCAECLSTRILCCFQCYNTKKPHHNKTTAKAPWCCCTRDECGIMLRETEERIQGVSMTCAPARCFDDIRTNEESIRMNMLNVVLRIPITTCTIAGMTYCVTHCAVCVNCPYVLQGLC